MKIIALTGGIGCGKTTAAAVFRSCGAAIVDADAISREQTAPGGIALPAIREAFGEGVFREDGTLDRKALACVIFGDEAARLTLNAITHPLIREEMVRQIEAYRKEDREAVILDVPLLFETGTEKLADKVICLSLGKEAQLERLISRGMTREEALSRVRAQMPAEERERRSDCVVSTDRPPEETARALKALYREILKEGDPA